MSNSEALHFVIPNAPGKLTSIILAVTIHLVLLAFLFYGIPWQNQEQESNEVEVVHTVPPPRVESHTTRETPPAPTLPAVKLETESVKLLLLPEPENSLKEKVKTKPPVVLASPRIEHQKEELTKSPRRSSAKPLSDLFQKLLDQDLKQTASLKSAESDKAAAAEEFTKIRTAQATLAHNKSKVDYITIIRGKIKGNIVLPPGINGNPEAVFDVVQLPSGEILSAKLMKSSSFAAFDEAVERAILKSSPLPRPVQAGVFSRELELRFRPLEE